MSHLVRQQRRPSFRSVSSPFYSLADVFDPQPDPPNRIKSILAKSRPIEPKLDPIAPLLNPQIVSSVIKDQRYLPLAFRFFIWAIKYRSIRAWEVNDVIIDIFLKQKQGFFHYTNTLKDLKKWGVGFSSDAFIVLILGYFKAGKAAKAVESFGMMKDFDCKPNVYTYNAVLHVMVKQNVVMLALAVYNQMLKINCEPNVATYSILIDGLCRDGKVKDALLLFHEMTERAIVPNTITYTNLLLGLCQADRPNEAKEFLSKMTSKECLPDSITYDGLLAGFCKLGKVDEALLLLRVFEKQGHVLGTTGYSCLIDGMFKIGRFKEAYEWFDKVLKENIAPDVVLYTIMFHGLCAAGRVLDAWKLFQEMTERGVAPDTQCYNTLIRGFCAAGLLKEARSLKLEISKNGCFPNAYTQTILICGTCRKGLIAEAKHIFDKMEKSGCLPSAVTFNALIDGLCKAGKLKEARLMFYKMEIGRNPSLFLRLSQGTDRVMNTSSLHALIARLCDSGSYLKAYSLLSKLVDTGALPDIFTYNILVNGMCISGNIDNAFNIFKELQLRGETPDAVTYGTLINGFFKSDREEEAMVMVKEMINKGISPSIAIYKSLMTWYCRKGKVSMSFRFWLDYLRKCGNQDVNEIKLIEEHLKKGQVEEAVRNLLKIDLKRREFDVGPYTIWLIGFVQAGSVKDASKIFRVLQEFNVTVTPLSCAKLIRACCQKRKLNPAADVFLYAIENGFTIEPKIREFLLCSMFRSRFHVDRAISVLSKMAEKGFDLDTDLSKKTKSLWQYQIALRDIS